MTLVLLHLLCVLSFSYQYKHVFFYDHYYRKSYTKLVISFWDDNAKFLCKRNIDVRSKTDWRTIPVPIIVYLSIHSPSVNSYVFLVIYLETYTPTLILNVHPCLREHLSTCLFYCIVNPSVYCLLSLNQKLQ